MVFGAVAIGSISNAGASALENKSWTNIGFSATVGIAVGGYGAGKLLQIVYLKTVE